MNIKQIKENFVPFSCMMLIGATVSSLLISASPASAALTTLVSGCRAGGFSGKIRINYERVGTRKGFAIRGIRVREVLYRIEKGNNQGGNKANVGFTDNGTLPVVRFYTGDRGIQDGRWHRLGGNYNTSGSNGTSFKFVFDKSLASDPRCEAFLKYPGG
jgi:hypothetical protein